MNIAIREKMHPTLGVMVRDNGEVLVPKSGVHKEHWTKGCWSQRYYRVQINGTKYLVHRLVAETFIDNPDNLPFADHIDHDRRNCAASNIRWTDYTGNNRNTVRCDASFEKYGVHKYEDVNAYWRAWRLHKKGLN